MLSEKVVHRPQPAKLLAEDINRHTGNEDGRCTSDILVGTCNRAKSALAEAANSSALRAPCSEADGAP